MEHSTESGTIAWTASECPFRIECSARVLDDIRLAVVDAFFSLPRGGAEIGGILLGEFQDNLITITAFEALDCEHAMGPSFTLSSKDQVRLAEMTARARRNGPNRQPMGWYHSHTRSEIFLSEADQDLHNRFFPDPWQIALVLKPHTFEPTRAGYFFREPDGSIHGAASYQVFQLEPLPLRAPSGNGSHSKPAAHQAKPTTPATEPPPAPAPAMPGDAAPETTAEQSKRRVPITREVVVEPPSDSPAELSTQPLPEWGAVSQDRPWRVMKAAAILAIGLAAGGAGYQSREYWLPHVLTKVRAVLPREPDSYVSLVVSDENGQMKIQWDRTAPAVRNALDALLEISDGNSAPQAVRLDATHLAVGTFTYAREHERVDITLMATEPDGKVVKEQTSFLGKLPSQKAAPEVPSESDADKARAEKLQKDSNFQAAKIKKLERDLKAAQDELQQKSTAPDPAKKN